MGAFSLVTSTTSLNNPIVRELMAKSPIPANIQYALMYAGVLVILVSGVAMLRRHNWARLLYVGWNIVSITFTIATSPMRAAMIPSLIVFLVIVFFLFRPKANEYFKAPEVP
jgi:cytochrome b561